MTDPTPKQLAMARRIAASKMPPLHPHRGRRMSHPLSTLPPGMDRISKAAAGKDER